MTSKKKEVAYIVVRNYLDEKYVPIGVFTNLDDASDSKDMWAQEFVDKGIAGFEFEIYTTAFYD